MHHKEKIVKYSCFVSSEDKFVYQGWLWIHSLIKFANVKPENIYVHHSNGIPRYFLDQCQSLNVNTMEVEEFGDKTYCNKISQLTNKELYNADMVLFMDTDTVVLENFENRLDFDKINAKTVDTPNPKLEKFEEVLREANITGYETIHLDVFGCETIKGNFNGGLYAIPGKYLAEVKDSWEKWTLWLLEKKLVLKGNKHEYIDQVSFTLMINDLKHIPYHILDTSFNFPFHLREYKMNEAPYLLHYHWYINEKGLLYTDIHDCEVSSKVIAKVNKMAKECFDIRIFSDIDRHGVSQKNKEWFIRTSTGNPNDLSPEMFLPLMDNLVEHIDHFMEVVETSRNSFGWYTKHLPRVYEYPWIIEAIENSIEGKKICDFGAGVSPIPLILSRKGASVFTIDNNVKRIDLEKVQSSDEWGFFDYSKLDHSIVSINKSLEVETFDDESMDIIYSISVVEHMPAKIRRRIFEVFKRSTKINGELILTLDLFRGNNNLWNYCYGEVVESVQEHGTIEDIVQELFDLGFALNYKRVIRLDTKDKIDIALLRLTRMK